MLKKVISGGQTGVDQAALQAARKLGYETGGTCARGWETEEGLSPWLRDYGLVEADKDGYPYRTAKNVQDSDGTLLITSNWGPGSRLTRDKCISEGKTYYVASPDLWTPDLTNDFRCWIFNYEIEVLNVAGTRESSSPGIHKWTYGFLVEALLPF